MNKSCVVLLSPEGKKRLLLTFQTIKFITFVKKIILISTLGQFRSAVYMMSRLTEINWLGSECINIMNRERVL